MLLALAASSGFILSTMPGSTPCRTAIPYRQSPSFTLYPPGMGPKSATPSTPRAPIAAGLGAACADLEGGGR